MYGGDIEIPSDGNKLTDKMKSLMAGYKRGQTIVFKAIKSIGPDGKIRDLNPIVLKIEDGNRFTVIFFLAPGGLIIIIMDNLLPLA